MEKTGDQEMGEGRHFRRKYEKLHYRPALFWEAIGQPRERSGETVVERSCSEGEKRFWFGGLEAPR